MKDERNVRHRRTAGGNWRPVAIILAAVLMVLSVPLGGRAVFAADPIDLGKDCVLTINPGSDEMAADLSTANVVIDLYRVADAVEFTGYDTYKLENTLPFADLVIPEKVDNAGWKEIAQKAADIVLGTAPESGAKEWDPAGSIESIRQKDPTVIVEGEKPNTPITLKPGLYLIIAHGSDIQDYAMVNEADPSSPDAPAAGTVTVANSRTYAYKFAPELISLPTKEAVENVINTANPGPWIYDPTIRLKPVQEVRVGDLRIIKNLVNYRVHTITGLDGVTREVYDESTFVFKVTAYKSKAAYEEMGEDAPKVYNDYASMMFTGAKESSVLIKDLPVDAYVIVKEEYSGKTYEPVEGDPDTKDTIIIANDTVEVRFANKYDDRHGGGGSVTNKFTYHEGMSDWGWERVTDSSESGTVIPPKPKN